MSSNLLLPQAAPRGLLVQRLGVGGGGGDVSVTGSLVRAGGLLQSLGISKVGGASSVVGGGVVGDEVKKSGKHLDVGAGEHASVRATVDFKPVELRILLTTPALLARRRAPDAALTHLIPPPPITDAHQRNDPWQNV